MKILLLTFSSLFINCAVAEEVNQRNRLAPDLQLKINATLAQSYLKKDKKPYSQDNNRVRRFSSSNNGGNVQNINSIKNVRYAPREVTTAVRGDIVNICFHCR